MAYYRHRHRRDIWNQYPPSGLAEGETMSVFVAETPSIGTTGVLFCHAGRPIFIQVIVFHVNC